MGNIGKTRAGQEAGPHGSVQTGAQRREWGVSGGQRSQSDAVLWQREQSDWTGLLVTEQPVLVLQ